ncbi:pVII [Fowl aviadenovirus 4]|nr:pVII [Fowl aviadenovirus 4]
MSILISPNNNTGWGMRRRSRSSSMRGVGMCRRARPLTLRSLLGLGTRRRRGSRRSRPRTTSRLVVVRTRTSSMRRRR